MVNTTNEPVRMNRDKSVPNPAVIADDPQVIRAQIEKTRAQMGHTLDEIQVRLSPEYIKQQTQESIREATIEKVEKMAQTAEYKVKSWRSNAIQAVKDNPVPAAMIGIGIGWMLLSDKNGGNEEYEYPERYYGSMGEVPPRTTYYNRRAEYGSDEPGAFSEAQSRVAETAENAQEWVGEQRDKVQQSAHDASEAVRENVSEVTTRAQNYVSETADHARERAEAARMQAEESAEYMRQQTRLQVRRAKRTFWHTMEENPLAVGVAAAAAGALIGLALPATEKENELMGETRDRLVQEASATAEKTLHKAQSVAEHAAHTAVEDVKREAEKQDLPMPSAAKDPKRSSTQSTPSASA